MGPSELLVERRRVVCMMPSEVLMQQEETEKRHPRKRNPLESSKEIVF